MGNEDKSRGRSDRSFEAAIEHLGERLLTLSCDLAWDFTPPVIGLWWLRRRVARLDQESEALRRVATIHRSAQDRRSSLSRRIAARRQQLEAEYATVDRRFAELERRTRKGSIERRHNLILIAYFLLGWAMSYLGWISELLEVQDAFSQAVSGEPD